MELPIFQTSNFKSWSHWDDFSQGLYIQLLTGPTLFYLLSVSWILPILFITVILSHCPCTWHFPSSHHAFALHTLFPLPKIHSCFASLFWLSVWYHLILKYSTLILLLLWCISWPPSPSFPCPTSHPWKIKQAFISYFLSTCRLAIFHISCPFIYQPHSLTLSLLESPELTVTQQMYSLMQSCE